MATRDATLGAQLERMRLELRAHQLERVLQRLRHRARAADAGPAERTGLQRAIVDFGEELAQVRQRLEQGG